MEVNFSIENNERNGLVIKDRVGRVLFATTTIEETETTRYKFIVKDRLGRILKTEPVCAADLRSLDEEDLQLWAIIGEGKATANVGYAPNRASKDLINCTLQTNVENKAFVSACFDREGFPLEFLRVTGQPLHSFDE